ncbi:MAG: FeoA family protein [Christensenellales bacterium]|jgi:ferrous iron transport protein A|nr:ferrous iron transport protein A [Clostridiales bacterium]
MPLTLLKAGETARITRITGNDATRARLAELGFVVGELVQVISDLGGNLIIGLKGSRVALGRDMAARIMI